MHRTEITKFSGKPTFIRAFWQLIQKGQILTIENLPYRSVLALLSLSIFISNRWVAWHFSDTLSYYTAVRSGAWSALMKNWLLVNAKIRLEILKGKKGGLSLVEKAFFWRRGAIQAPHFHDTPLVSCLLQQKVAKPFVSLDYNSSAFYCKPSTCSFAQGIFYQKDSKSPQ